MLSVFDFQNYREFLRSFYNTRKSQKNGFTYATFASDVGLKSPNYYKLVMEGQKNLTSQNILKFVKGLGLQGAQQEYFEALVHFNQAKNVEVRQYHQSRLVRMKADAEGIGRNTRTLAEMEFDAISHWLYSALLVLSNFTRFKEDPKWLSQRLFGIVSESEIKEALLKLEALGLLARDKEGRLRAVNKQLKTEPELKRIAVRTFYENFLSRTKESLALSSSDEREMGAYFVGISPSQLPEIRKRVRSFLAELNDLALENEKPEQVYALSFFAYPITTREG